MKLINEIAALFTTTYIVGTPECDHAFRIFNGAGWILTVLAVAFTLYILVKGKEIEARIIAQDKRKRNKKGK